ncbi:hypothetical protein E2C01_000614 [Portunus trituberculatus]|uniref:Uncharacterized protein n=1 Tax=Portunus trituberculatus TaxID=210409 RepID=A0A5B7CK75_PORTR|nr:hypothetical protein [Portunus trituberculatus]
MGITSAAGREGGNIINDVMDKDFNSGRMSWPHKSHHHHSECAFTLEVLPSLTFPSDPSPPQRHRPRLGH